jgi:cell division protein ZapA
MSQSVKTIDVKLLDKEMRVSCAEEEIAELMEAVDFLDKRMRSIRQGGKVVSTERIALMAALNIAHELLGTKMGRGLNLAEMTRRVAAMQTSIDQALAEQNSLF